jgi:hypothetical protein
MPCLANPQSPRTPHVTEKGYIYPLRCKLRSLDRQRIQNSLGKRFPPSYYLFSLAGCRISSAKSANFGPSCSHVTQTSDTHLRSLKKVTRQLPQALARMSAMRKTRQLDLLTESKGELKLKLAASKISKVPLIIVEHITIWALVSSPT